MMKRVLLGFLLLISSFFVLFNKTKMIDSEDLAVYVNDELVSSIPKKGEAIFIKSVCDNNGKASWDNETWGLLVTNMSKKTKCNLYFYEGQTVFNFDYTGGEQVFTVPVSGTYKLETWGAQGGYNGGFGGYSFGIIDLIENINIYLNVGGKGEDIESKRTVFKGGYNGGGNGGLSYDESCASGAGGGGATHIALKSGLLSTLENYKHDILIVSGGGGGGAPVAGSAGSGGGYKGNNSSSAYDEENNYTWGGLTSGATQNTGYQFGTGQTAITKIVYDGYSAEGNGGGGGGYYGGFANVKMTSKKSIINDAGSGGSGYIGNYLLTNKIMYCYNCEESSEVSTKTISTTCSEEAPTENCAKKGNGYARITLVSIDE